MSKIQDLPESTRKIIFWIAIIIVGLGLLSWWAQTAQERMRSVRGEEMKEGLGIPFLEEQLKEMPKIEMPEIDEETLKKIEQLFKEAEQQAEKPTE